MLKVADVQDLVDRAISTKSPDFVYNTGGRLKCHYYPLGDSVAADDPRRDTGCLVGTALFLAGETRHLGRTDKLHSATAWALYNQFSGLMSARAAQYLNNVQAMQDRGSSWGNSRAFAEDGLRNGAFDQWSDEE